VTKQRICVISRTKANLFGYLTAALLPSEGLEFVVDRRTARHEAYTPRTPESDGERRHVTVADSELTARGWILVTRDNGSDTWACDSNPIVAAVPRRRQTHRARRERRAFIYIGGVVASLGLAVVAALVLIGGYRLPGSFTRGILGRGTAAVIDAPAADPDVPPATAPVLSPAREPEAMRPERTAESKRREPTSAARRHRP